LWPFSTLGWPDQTEDLKTFYPTSLMISGFDILFFWIARMMMLGIWCTGEAPFREVHLHGLVRDAERQKISKTKGNVVDPLDLIEKFGTDACRIGLLVSAAPGADIALKEDRLAAARSFANKLWNASRLLFMNMERSGVTFPLELVTSTEAALPAEGARTEDTWIFHRFNECCATVNRALATHRYHEVAQTLWDFLWHEFCDWYLEVKKLRFTENSGLTADWRAALTIYERSLRLLHPFMPFLTEELWQRLVHLTGDGAKPGSTAGMPVSVSVAAFPQPNAEPTDEKALREFALLQQVVTAARELRADHKLDSKATFPADLYVHECGLSREDLAVISTIARLDLRQHVGAQPASGGLLRSATEFDLRLEAEAPAAADGAAGDSRARVEREIASIEKVIRSSKRQLSDEVFLSKAPAKVVDTLKNKLAEYEQQLKKLRDQLEGFE
jgi:valyl-tRNA synthetase